MIEAIKKWCIEFSKELSSETISTANDVCNKTKKANSDFVKAIMESI